MPRSTRHATQWEMQDQEHPMPKKPTLVPVKYGLAKGQSRVVSVQYNPACVLPVFWSHEVPITRAIKQKMPVSCTAVPQAKKAQMCSLMEFIQAGGRGWITS